MNYFMVLLVLQSLEDLYREPPDQTLWYSLKIIVLYKFIEVDAQAFKSYHQVLSKEQVVFNPDDVILIIFVMMIKIFQNLQLYSSLILKFLFVSDDFKSD